MTEKADMTGSAFRPVVAVDLDGVLASWDRGSHGEIGPPIPGAAEFTRELGEWADVVIFTCRCSEAVYKPQKAHLLARAVEQWLDRYGFAYHHVWQGHGKVHADAFIDDRAVHCRPERDPTAYRTALRQAAELAGAHPTFRPGPAY